MENKDIFFLFPSLVFSGHEKMALKILELFPDRTECILNKELVAKFTLRNKVYSYVSLMELMKILFEIRFQRRKVTIIIVAGSPYGFLLEKLAIKLLGFSLIDYVPVPELKVIQDRFYHRLMPIFNKIVVDKRVLIDNWQIQYSAVKKCTVIKNIIQND